MSAIGMAASGANITTGAASARIAIPVASGSRKPNFVRVCASVAAYIKPGDSTVTAAAGDMLLNPETPVVLRVGGFTHIAGIQLSAAGVVNVVPLEDIRL
jgi:hypothetical protein